jgi:hypothetical protein
MFVMVKERYTGFQLHRVNDSDGLMQMILTMFLLQMAALLSLYTILN